ncbi:hypothetical protein HDV57DRAFT_506032 [Trichoderma longibrachiatum]
MPKGSYQDRPVEIVEQSEAHLTRLLVEEAQSPWTKYAHGESAIATMLSTETLERTFGARAGKSYGPKAPENMVFRYYSKRNAATKEPITQLISLAQQENKRKKQVSG